MNAIILITILIMLWFITLGAAFLFGFVIANKKKKHKKTDVLTYIDEEQMRLVKKSEKEMENMLSYNGDEQEDINAI